MKPPLTKLDARFSHPDALATKWSETLHALESAELFWICTVGCNDWDRGLDVSVEGTAVPVTDEDLLRRLAQGWAAKWDGKSWDYEVRDGAFHHESGAAAVFRVAPSKVLAFGKGIFSHTQHVF